MLLKFQRPFDSLELFTSRYSFVSSANSFVMLVKSLIKSLMYITNSSGPSTVPCEMPLITFSQEDGFPSTTTLCFLLLKNDCIDCSMLPFIHKAFTFEISLLCCTESNAFAKSVYIMSTTPPFSIMRVKFRSSIIKLCVPGDLPGSKLFNLFNTTSSETCSVSKLSPVMIFYFWHIS